MAFLVSPGVQVKEVDLTNVVPAVATSIGAIAGAFEKGPVSSVTTITSEEDLIKIFGKPNSSNFENWYSAANFLQYTNSLRVVRAESGIVNAVASGSAILIRDTDHYLGSFSAGEASVGEWAARTAGTHGNSLGISICASATAYEEMLTSSNQTVTEDAAGSTSIAVDDIDASGDEIHVHDIISFFSDSAGTTPVTGEEGKQYEVTAINTSTNVATIRRLDDPNGGGTHSIIPDNSFIKRRWRFYDRFDGAPGTSAWSTQNGRGTGDEIHVVVFDTTGDITGSAIDVAGERQNAIIETFANMSKNPNAKTAQGSTNYYPNVIYNQSQFVYWMDHNSSGTNWGSAALNTTFTNVTAVSNVSLSGGANGSVATVGQLKTAYEKFQDAETVDINLIIAGTSSATHIDNLITIAEDRKDAIVFASPERADVVNVADSSTQVSNVVAFFNGIRSSSYVVFDSGYKYAYDRYNDVFRFVPLCGDMAGLCARTDLVADSHFSPAGFNRGVVRGAVKLAFNPTKQQRDDLYRARVNPVVTFPGQGTILFGDKTGLSKPSAFDRINVRRLFITLEKAISTASKFQLFEFNDEFTRAQFRNIVEPFLRDVQGRRGITDFLVVCDETNNTGEVIDRNEFKADIFVKPARSINFITLTFVATRTGVSFDEVVGA